MNIGKPLKDFAHELVRQSKLKQDFIVAAPTLEMLLQTNAVAANEAVNLASAISNTEKRPPALPSGFSMRFGDFGPFPMRNLTHDQLQEFVNIPRAYYERMRREAPGLLILNVREWLQRSNDSRMIRTLDGQARAFLSDRYRPLDNNDLFKAIIEPIARSEAQIESCEITETRLYIKAVSHKITIQPKVGDVVEAGVLIQNSEVGMGRLIVGPFLKRLSCSNGMCVDEYATKRTHLGKRMGRRGGSFEDQVSVGGGGGSTGNSMPEEWMRDETRVADDRAFFMKVQDAVSAYFSPEKFAEIERKATQSTKRGIDADPVKVVKVIANDYGLKEDEESSVLQHLIRGGDLSQWGLLNAVTRHAGDVQDYDRATDLEKAGGQIMALADNDWERLLKDSKTVDSKSTN